MPKPSYHLWLAPSGEPRDALDAIIRNLAEELGGPAFEPHVTLLNDLEGDERENLALAGTLAARLQPTRITLTEPGYTEEFFRCVFMHVEPTPEVVQMRALAEEVFGRAAGHYMPHLSLVYGTFESARKRAVVAHLPPEARTSFVAEALHVIRADSVAPADWSEIARFALTASPPRHG